MEWWPLGIGGRDIKIRIKIRIKISVTIQY